MTTTISYFNGRGLAEPIRLIMTFGGEKFEDVRAPLEKIPGFIPPEIKKLCTWGQVPIVEFGDKKLAQSLAITRYFAKKHNLVPKDDFQAALCDEYVDACRDFMMLWVPIIYQETFTDESKRKARAQEILNVGKERFLNIFSSIVEANNSKHLVGETWTWADIYLVHTINNTEITHGVSILPEFPALKTLSDNFYAIPSIKAWMKTRPTTKF